MSSFDVTVIIPTIPTRHHMLTRAVMSVANSNYPVRAIIIESDLDRTGAPTTRQRALEKVTTEWYLPLDDDDMLKPEGLHRLIETQLSTGADYVYGHYDVIGGEDPRPENLGAPFDPANPVQTTIVALARTETSLKLGGYLPDYEENLSSPDRMVAGEDWRLTKRYIDAKLHIAHSPHKVFDWFHHGANTSGLPDRW